MAITTIFYSHWHLDILKAVSGVPNICNMLQKVQFDEYCAILCKHCLSDVVAVTAPWLHVQHSGFTILAASTRWKNVNLPYVSGSKKMLLLKDYRSAAQKLTNQNNSWHRNVRFSWPEDNDLPPRCRHYLFLTCSYRDNPAFFTQPDN